MVKSYPDLQVWEAGVALSVAVYEATQSFPKQEWFGLVSQMRRAACSVPANVAEGSGRQHTAELVQFLHIARGSLNELQTFIQISERLSYLDSANARSLNEKIASIGRMLHGLIGSLKSKRQTKAASPQPRVTPSAPATNHQPPDTPSPPATSHQPPNTPSPNRRTYNYTIVETAQGWVALAGRNGKVSAIEFPKPTREEAVAGLGAGIDGELVESNEGFGPLAGQIRDYFAGNRTEFTFEPDLADLTEFQQKVL
jgi:four helix bundle protein